MPFLAPCQVKTKGKNETIASFVFMAGTDMLENQDGYI
ncbi:hypothetical protein BTH41_02285 [Bacillus mycoides]|nr:hypothetical protein BTH41_02285 [Bacillus mycoides]